MSTDVSDAFIKDYQADVHDVFQRRGAQLRVAVRFKTGIVGTTTTFQVSGKGIATTKARHGVITPMNQSHDPQEATLVDFYAGDFVDKLDESKMNSDERGVIARGGAWALGRKVDEQIFTALATTGSSVITITVTSAVNVRATILQWVEALNIADVPNDGRRYGAVTPRLWSQMTSIKEFSDADFVGSDGLPFTIGVPAFQKFKDWLGILWLPHTDVPGRGTTTADPFIWHADAVGYAAGAHAGNNAVNDAIQADIWWNGERAAHFVNHMMSGGAVAIDDTGIIQALVNDQTAIITS